MTAPAEQGIDLKVLWYGIRRRLWWILGLGILFAALAYFTSKAQPPVYQASASISAANSQGQDGVFGTAAVKAPPLPDGTVAQAMRSNEVISPLISAVSTNPSLEPKERSRLVANLTQELRAQQLSSVILASQLDTNGNGVYTLRTSARTARAAQVLANLSSKALLDWDRNRALQTVRRAQAGFRAQLAQIDLQIAALRTPTLSLGANGKSQVPVELQTLITRRATLQDSLVQVNILENSASGVLTLLSSAVMPLAAVSPKPLQNAVLAGLLGLLLATGAVMVLTALDRTVRSEDDLMALGVAPLAVIPRLPQRTVLTKGIVRAAREVGLYEAIGFLRVHLNTVFQEKAHPILMISSTSPGEGKSSLTATLADGFASSGQRILIIDADLRRGVQDSVWHKYGAGAAWHQLCGEDGARSTSEALQDPGNVQVLRVEENVDMLPAGPGLQNSLSLFNQADLSAILRNWSQHYDLVLIDSAPLLAVADGLVLGVHTDGVLMVTEYGRTNAQTVRSSLRRAERSGLNIVGFVINKSDARDQEGYNYAYNYSPGSQNAKV